MKKWTFCFCFIKFGSINKLVILRTFRKKSFTKLFFFFENLSKIVDQPQNKIRKFLVLAAWAQSFTPLNWIKVLEAELQQQICSGRQVMQWIHNLHLTHIKSGLLNSSIGMERLWWDYETKKNRLFSANNVTENIFNIRCMLKWTVVSYMCISLLI